MHVNAKCKEDRLKTCSVRVNDRLSGWTLVFFCAGPTSTREELLVNEWLTDRACWPPKACVLIIEAQPLHHSSFLQIVTEKGRLSLSASECAWAVKRNDVQRWKRTNSIHSCRCLCCYILIILYRMYIKHVHTLKSVLLPIWYNTTWCECFKL